MKKLTTWYLFMALAAALLVNVGSSFAGPAVHTAEECPAPIVVEIVKNGN